MLDLSRINSKTASVFKLIAESNSAGGDPLSGMTMVDGTALSMRLGHRDSLDLDFASNQMKLDAPRILSLINAMRARGISCINVTDVGAIDDFINDGLDIADYQQDWLINDIKVQFFSYGKNDAERAALDGEADVLEGIRVATIEMIAKTKAHVVCKRTKSRDLFDIATLLSGHHVEIDDVLAEMQRANPYLTYEQLRYLLVGKPVGVDDEGLSPVSVTVTIEEIRRAIASALDEFESRVANALTGSSFRS